MQVIQEQRTFNTDGIDEVLEAEVELSTYFFDMLSGLYSDTIGAIMREYSTNMYDGHVRLGLKRCQHDPIIHLPTALEPWIEFKDFGSGMSPEDVRNVFRRYGASTKRKSNDEVGGMGLGSKVAFAYKHVDQWTFETRWNGKRHVWAATRNEHGIPVFVPLDTHDTREPNGVTVRIPVARGDFNAFREAATKYLRFYPIQVQVTGVADFSMPTREARYTGKDWELLKANLGEARATVVMGNVPYPVENKYVDEVFGTVNYGEKPGTLVLFQPIGSMSLVPSREALKYDEATVRRIKQALQQVKSDMVGIVEAELASAPTRWLAGRALVEQEKIYWFRNFSRKPRYKGEEISSHAAVRKVRKDLIADGYSMLRHYKPRSTQKGYEMEESILDEIRFDVREDTLIIVHDLPEVLDKTIASRMRQFIVERCLTPQPSRKTGGTTHRVNHGMTIFFVRSAKKPDEVSEYFGGIPTKALSTLPVPPKQPRLPREKKPKAVIVPLRRFTLQQFEWQEASVNPANEPGAIWVPLAANEATEPSPFTSRSILGTVLRAFRDTGIHTNAIYGIPRSHKSVEKTEGWTSIADPIWKERIIQLLQEYRTDFALFRSYEKVFDGSVGRLLLRAMQTGSEADLAGLSAPPAVLELIRAATLHKKLDSLDTLLSHYNLEALAPAPAQAQYDLESLFATAPVLATMRSLLNVIPYQWVDRAITEITPDSLTALRQYVYEQAK